MKTLQNFINGQKVQSSSDKTQDLINPATGEVFAKAPVSNSADVDAIRPINSKVLGVARLTLIFLLAGMVESNAILTLKKECKFLLF